MKNNSLKIIKDTNTLLDKLRKLQANADKEIAKLDKIIDKLDLDEIEKEKWEGKYDIPKNPAQLASYTVKRVEMPHMMQEQSTECKCLCHDYKSVGLIKHIDSCNHRTYIVSEPTKEKECRFHLRSHELCNELCACEVTPSLPEQLDLSGFPDDNPKLILLAIYVNQLLSYLQSKEKHG